MSVMYQGDESGEENEMKNQPKEEEDESEKAAQAFARDLERERAGMSFSKAMEEDEGNEDGEEEDAEDGEQSDDDVEDEGSDDEGNEVEGDVPVEKKQTEEQEHHELSKVRSRSIQSVGDDDTHMLSSSVANPSFFSSLELFVSMDVNGRDFGYNNA